MKDPIKSPTPSLSNIVQYDLGKIKNVPLAFTDSTEVPLTIGLQSHESAFLYLAGAEASKSTFDDGEVTGSVVGFSVCEHSSNNTIVECKARYTFLRNPDNSPFLEKAEGIVLNNDNNGDSIPHNAIIVLDPDADHPGRVCSVVFQGLERK